MKKEEYIKRYGEEAWAKILEQGRARYNANRENVLEQKRAYYKAHKEAEKAYSKKYREEHPEHVAAYSKKYREQQPEKMKANSQEQNRKGGKYYEKQVKDQRTGIPGAKNKIRRKHQKQYKQYKQIIAPDSELHHNWLNDGTATYSGVALVEKHQHRYGIIDVIQILEGKITLLTEEEVKTK